jgi:hypothetical protein
MNDLVLHLPHYSHNAQMIGLAVLAVLVTALAVALFHRSRRR